MRAYKARDVVATLAHGARGAFWIALAFGMWFVGLAYITWTAAFGVLAENLALFAVLGTLAAGSSLSAAGLISGGFASGWTTAGGWLFVISAGLSWYTLSAMTLLSVSGRAILPTGKYEKAANVPGGERVRPIELEWAEPGVGQGQ